IQPAVAELRQRAGTQAAPDDESIRRRMLRDFGTPVLFVLALSLLAAISLYRSLGVGLDWREDFNAITALCASFLMLVIAVGGVFLRAARRLADPLSRLAEASDRVASGNLDAAMPNVEGPREVVALAERIEDMRQTLAETIDALEQERSGLESRVIARTTELEEAIDELKRTQAALVHGERMASIGELMAGVAHEVFNPLNAISGSVSALERLSQELEAMLAAYRERESHLPPEDREALEAERERLDVDGALQDLAGVARVVTSATKRCVRIVGNLKRFARAAEDPVATDLHASLNETVALLAHRIKQHDIEVSTDYGQLPEILCRDGEIGQVFMNLLSYAIFAAASAQGSHDGRIHLCTRRDDDLVVIEVQDNGSGVPEELQDKIFEPFFTTKSRMDGTGLGLSISQDIVRRHGGQLALVSPGFLEGARFRCELPLAGPKARPSHKGIVGAPSRNSS
ncbi:MAG: ATP-binding protein, partial [Polyangiaceae bacterium]